MKLEITTRAIDLIRNADGSVTPRDAGLHEAVQQFCFDEIGRNYDFSLLYRGWAALAGDKVVAVSGLATAIDCPLFHVASPSGRQELAASLAARNALIERMKHAIEDAGNKGAKVLIRVDPDALGKWTSFLSAIGAEPANRYIIEI